jgi:hypothetical protein
MSKECKQARNIVLTTIIIVMSILILCSSCGTQNTCAAYASIETKSNK